MIVEKKKKNTKDGSLVFVDRPFNVDIEQDGFRFYLCGTVNHHIGCRIVLKFFAETLHTANAVYLFVLQQIGEHFQEVRFTTSKESGNPHAGISGRLIQSVTIIVEKCDEVLFQFFGNDVLI